MTSVKLRPEQPRLRYVGIDVTEAVDTVAWGDTWNASFGWDNLLWELDKDANYPKTQTRIDNAHPDMPIQRLRRSHKGQEFKDTVLMPQGVDGAGAFGTPALDAATKFMQAFILNPRADKPTSSLSAGGSGVGADVIYISSHGLLNGAMFGGASFLNIFEPAKAAVTGEFAGPSWVILSNCSTLDPQTHGDWLKLMGGKVPLRGIVGFQHACPLAQDSVDFVGVFIQLLALKKTILTAWRSAITQKVSPKNWVVLCHKEAQNDTISDWNAGKLAPIPAGSDILFFDDSTAGTVVTPPADPYEAFWSRAGTRITVVNMNDAANLLRAGDAVAITVKPQPPAATFADKTPISITLIYIRPDYPQNIDVNQLFTVTGRTGSVAGVPATDNLNPESPGGDDSWNLVVTGTPTEVTLSLQCKDLSMLKHKNEPVFMYLRVDISGTKTDFRRNAGITPLI